MFADETTLVILASSIALSNTSRNHVSSQTTLEPETTDCTSAHMNNLSTVLNDLTPVTNEDMSSSPDPGKVSRNMSRYIIIIVSSCIVVSIIIITSICIFKHKKLANTNGNSLRGNIDIELEEVSFCWDNHDFEVTHV